MRILISLFLFMFLFQSCATNKDFPERILDLIEKQADKLTSEISEEKVVNSAKLPEQFNLAIYFKPPDAAEKWNWSRHDKEEVTEALENLKQNKIHRTFELINTTGQQEYTELRKMAAQQGADAILVVQGISQVDSSFNPWAWSYLVVAPLLFVDGNDVSGVFISQALLWDVKKPYIHLGVQSEGEWTMKRPLAFKQRNRAVQKSREKAMNTLTFKLKKNFQEVIL